MVLLAWVASGAAGASEPKVVALGQRFTLKIGESAQIEGGGLQIGFENVSADSRCPKGEQCIREGEATIRVWLRKASGPKETHELQISSQDEGAVTYLGYEADRPAPRPLPGLGQGHRARDYQATLAVAGR